MKTISHFALFIFLVSIYSCGKTNGSNKPKPLITESEIQEILKNQNFECASLGGICPSGIARIFIINKVKPDRSSVCTGFMISTSRLVTNHHCVATQQQCSNTYLAIYTGSNHIQTKCKSIVKTIEDIGDPNDPNRKLDFTVMEITDNYLDDFFLLADTPAVADDLISTWVIDQTGLDSIPGNLLDSRITEFSCTVEDENERASLLLENCPIISGNSGSPALNNRGEVIGVIWGGSASAVDSSYNLNLRRKLNAKGLATEVKYFRDYFISDMVL